MVLIGFVFALPLDFCSRGSRLCRLHHSCVYWKRGYGMSLGSTPRLYRNTPSARYGYLVADGAVVYIALRLRFPTFGHTY